MTEIAGHPIEGLMTTAMENIKGMVDVNTVVGDAVFAPDGTVIIPVSKVNFGFAAGGGEYGSSNAHKNSGNGENNFAGGSGAGISINPMAFMVVKNETVKLIPVNSPVDRAVDVAASIADKLTKWICDKSDNNPVKPPDIEVKKEAGAETEAQNSEQAVQMNTNAEL